MRARTVEEQLSCVGMGGHALQQSKRVAHAVGGVRRQVRGREQRVDRDDFLEEGGHDT